MSELFRRQLLFHSDILFFQYLYLRHAINTRRAGYRSREAIVISSLLSARLIFTYIVFGQQISMAEAHLPQRSAFA